MTGVELIAKERQRQIEKEGWSFKKDIKTHPNGELAMAATCYLLDYFGNQVPETRAYYRNQAITNWPWAEEWWKPTPKDPIRQLTKAGALVAAEIDRLQRSGKASLP